MERKVLLKTNSYAQILFCWAIKGTVLYRHRGLVRWIGQRYFKEWFINEAEYHFRVGLRKFWKDEEMNLFFMFCDQIQYYFLVKVTQGNRKGLENVVSNICTSLVKTGKNILLVAEDIKMFQTDNNEKFICIHPRTSIKGLGLLLGYDFDIIVVFGVNVSAELLYQYIIPMLSTSNKMFINFSLPGDASNVYDQLMQLDPPLFRIFEQ